MDNVTVPISDDLTALIGGRGTGKSTVIESLRFALGIDPIGKEAIADHKAIVKDVLKSGTIVRVTVESPKPMPRRYTIERVVNQPPLVKDARGTATNQRPEDVMPKVEIFGQHELAELATDPARVATMLQRFTGSDGPDSAHQETLSMLSQNREELGKAEEALARLDDELSVIPRLDEQIRQYDTTDVPTKLTNQQRLGQDEAVFTEATERIAEASKRLRALTDPQLGNDLTAAYDSVQKSPQKTHLERATSATVELGKVIIALSAQAQAAVTTAQSAVAAAKTDWDAAVGDQRNEYNEVLRLLHDQGLAWASLRLEPDKYVDTKRALETVKAKEPRRKKLAKSIGDLAKRRGTLLADLQDHEKRQAEKLHDAVRAANSATGGVVIVQPVPAPERGHIKKTLAGHITGVRTDITAAIESEEFSPRAFVSAARAGADELVKHGIKGVQAQALLKAGESLFRELEELAVGLAVDVKLDIG